MIPAPPLKSSSSKSKTASLTGAIASPCLPNVGAELRTSRATNDSAFCLVRVAAKRQQPVKNNLALLLVGDLDISPLNKCAHFVHAAEEDELCAGGPRCLLKLRRV